MLLITPNLTVKRPFFCDYVYHYALVLKKSPNQYTFWTLFKLSATLRIHRRHFTGMIHRHNRTRIPLQPVQFNQEQRREGHAYHPTPWRSVEILANLKAPRLQQGISKLRALGCKRFTFNLKGSYELSGAKRWQLFLPTISASPFVFAYANVI